MKKSKSEIETMYYLSHLQEGLLFHHIAEGMEDPYVIQIVYHIEGVLNVNAFEQAWRTVVQRHGVLRTAFIWEQVPRPIQIVQLEGRVPIDYEDWRGRPESEQNEVLHAVLVVDRHHGFEFKRAPLVRLRLIQTGAQAFELLCTYHHILLDGWSFQLVVRDVLACYETLIQGRLPRLAPVRPYRDYIAWLQGQDIQATEQFWRTYLTGLNTHSKLSIEAPSVLKEFRALPYAEQDVVLTEAGSEQVRIFARQHHLTLNTVLQGAWALLLQHYSESTEVVFGSTVSGRPPDLSGVDSMVGLFINTLPVRVRIDDDVSVASWLHALQEQNSTLRHYEYTPLPKIQVWSDLPSGQPLFETIVVFENFPIHELTNSSPHGLQFSSLPKGETMDGHLLTKGRNNYPLSLIVVPGVNIQIILCYARERFGHGAMTRLLAQYRRVVEWLITHPRTQLADVSLLTPDERTRVLVEWNPTHHEPLARSCVHELVEAQAIRIPQAVAVVYEDQTLTYAELNAQANQVAYALRARGVGPGIRVGLCLERSLELVVGLWGILKAGAAYVPVEPTLPLERLTFLLQDAGVAGLLTHATVRAGFSADTLAALHPIKLWDLRALREETVAPSCQENLPAPDPQTQAYLIYTSGSTGQPKGVAVSHRALVSYVSSVLARMAVPESAMQWALLSTVAADLGHTMLFGALFAGRTLHLLSTDRGFHPERMAEYMQRTQIDVLKLTPSHLAGLLDATQPEQILPKHCLVLGGEALPWSLVECIQGLASHCAVINHYGPTETTVGVLTHRIDPQATHQGATVPIGRPFAHSRAYILDRRMEPVPVGVPGELYLGGAGLAQGYHKQAGLTAERFVPDPFTAHTGERLYRTGDQARYREDGTIEFLGRRDQQVKLRGYRIELEEIEVRLRVQPDIHEAVVVVRESRSGAKQLVAYVVTKNGSDVSTDELRAALTQQLPDYMVPQVIILMEALPLTRNGKLDRTALPDPETLQTREVESETVPQTETEQILAEIWAEVLRREQVGRHDNFFELGGDSILSLQIIARAHRRGLKLTPKQLFEHPTVAGLASVAVVRRPDAVGSSNAPVMGTVPLTPIQHWFFEAQHPNSHHWNQAILLEVNQPVNFASLTQAVQALVGHHDALRLRFRQDETGQWMQTYAATETHDICQRVDLAALAQEQGKPWPEVLEGLATETQQSLDITQGPLLRVMYFDRGPGEAARLLLVIHHLVVDGVSWRVLVEDLETTYQQLEQSQTVSLPAKTTSLKTWREHLGTYADCEALHSELAYWVSEGQGPVPLLFDEPMESNLIGDTATVTVSLSPEETHTLLYDVPPVYRTEINDILLTALAQTLCHWSGQPSVQVELEGHGREDVFDGVDLSRTVGWFTTRFPVWLEPGTGGPGVAIQAIKAQLRQLPNKGIGYGILRYLSADETVRARLTPPQPPAISFNYLGQLDASFHREGLFTLAPESSGVSRDPQTRRLNWLDVNVQVGGRQLSVDWTYPSRCREAATMERLAHQYVDALQSLIAHCRTPDAGGIISGDFQEANLSDEELKDLLEEIG